MKKTLASLGMRRAASFWWAWKNDEFESRRSPAPMFRLTPRWAISVRYGQIDQLAALPRPWRKMTM